VSIYSQYKTLEYLLNETELVPNRRVAVDVGAYIGQWTEVMLAHFERVIAFEPYKASFDDLMSRCGCHPHLQAFKRAVLDRHGRVSLVTPINKKVYSQYAVQTGSGTIRCTTIDLLCLEACDLLKIDVEGAELLVLKGAKATIQRCRPIIIVENLRKLSEKHYGIPSEGVSHYLTELGYKKAFKKRPDVVWHPK